jgi:hypothetical protein
MKIAAVLVESRGEARGKKDHLPEATVGCPVAP